MQKTFLCRTLMTLVLILMAAGCARTDVRPDGEFAHTRLPVPEQVLIYDFAVSASDIRENSGLLARIGRNAVQDDQSVEQIQLGREVSDMLASELMVKVAEMGLNPQRATSKTLIPQRTVLITGHFVNIDEGNRLRRTVIGLGMGKSSLDCTVSVLVPKASGFDEIAAFDAHIESGKMPGVAVIGPAGKAAGADTGAVVASGAAIGGLKAYKSAAVQQARDMAERIAAELKKYFIQQGWIHRN
jgi:hypothetical protein